jgi:hypothetical protein
MRLKLLNLANKSCSFSMFSLERKRRAVFMADKKHWKHLISEDSDSFNSSIDLNANLILCFLSIANKFVSAFSEKQLKLVFLSRFY